MKKPKKLSKNVKKTKVLQLLEAQEEIPLELVARKIYNRSGKLEQQNIVRLLSAYRFRDKENFKARVKNGKVTII